MAAVNFNIEIILNPKDWENSCNTENTHFENIENILNVFFLLLVEAVFPSGGGEY